MIRIYTAEIPDILSLLLLSLLLTNTINTGDVDCTAKDMRIHSYFGNNLRW